VRATAVIATIALIAAAVAVTTVGQASAQPTNPEDPDAAAIAAEEAGLDAPAPEGITADESDAPAVAEGLVRAAEGEPTGAWVVQLDDPSLAAYEGGVPGFEATAPSATGDERLDVESEASVAYLDHLATEQDDVVERIERAIGRSVDVRFQYLNVLNALAIDLSLDEAETVAELEGVTAVFEDVEEEIDTDVSHGLINSPSIWDGATGPGLETRGEGVVVGMIDTGVNPGHPSFAEVDGDGYVHENPFGSGNFVGACDPEHVNHQDVCNDKLIGAWNFNTFGPNFPSVEDQNDHGSHVGSTIAGNVHDATFTVGADEHTREIQGVAPRANVISYLVCDPGCPQTASVAAVNQAIEDGVDVLNYSISGGDTPWTNIVDLAFLDAFNAGIFVAASAGNAGPGPSSVAKTGPWNASVAATTHSRVIAHELDVTAPTPVPPELEGMAAVPGAGPDVADDIDAEVRFAGLVDPGNVRGCTGFPADAFDGVIALIERGDCTFETKVNNASNAGAVAAIVFNDVAGPPISMGFNVLPDIPSVMIDVTDGVALRDLIVENDPTPVEVHLDASTHLIIDEDWEDIVAGFSSRGPSQFDVLAPTFAAPGVNILAAGREIDGDPDNYATIQGTSMSSPHGAGAGALLMALHPDWSPAQVRSALAMTADPEGLVKEDGETATDPLDVGSGRLDLAQAGRIGLVLDETHQNFADANPATGGDPRTLNVPGLVDQECLDTCSWTRTFESVAEVEVSYTATATAPDGASVSVDPSSFTIEPGGTQEVTVTLDPGGLPLGEWVFADVRLETDDSHGPDGEPVADVHLPVAAVPPPPELTVEPDELHSVLAVDEVVEQTLTIGNAGAGELVWELMELDPDMPGPAAASALDSAVIWEQPGSGTSGIISDHYNQLDAGVYSADDFVLPTEATIDLIHAEGFWNDGSLAEATAINWFIYPDDDGQPAGEPTDGQDAHVWTYSAPPTGTGVDITGDDITLDVLAATDEVIELDAGTYWLSVFPDIDSPTLAGATRWNWRQAETRGFEASLIDPEDLFEQDFTTWTTFSDVGLDWAGTAFRLEGSLACLPGEVSWLDLSPTQGTIGPGGETEVTVTFDSSGLEPGEHEGALCLESNDPARGQVIIPVTLEVIEIPRIEVAPDHLEAELWSGETAERELTISNVGDGELNWEIEDSDRLSLLTEGVLLIPDSTGNRVMAFDPETGDLIDEDFIPEDPEANLGTPQHVVVHPDGNLLLLSDQLRHQIYAIDFDGNFVGVFAPIGGADTSILQNMRGIAVSPDDTIWATSAAGGNAHAVPEFGADGSFLGNFIDNGAGGLAGPWFIEQRDDDILVTGQASDTIHRFAPDGSPIDIFHEPISFPQQLQELDNGNILVSNFSAPSGVWELTADGELIDIYTGVGSNRGVYELPNGNILTTNGSGVHEIDRGTELIETKASGGARKISHIQVDPECDAISDVPWLHADPESGSTLAGESDEVAVTIDAAGLEAGDYEAGLCINSDDPDTPRVVVPVTLTVNVYDQRVTAGSGEEYVDGDGEVWDADQRYDGDWGYMPRQASSRSTNRGIDGTDEEPKYQTARQRMSEYRFDGLPEANFEVEVLFAEIGNQRPGNRVFDVILDNTIVLPAYDIAATVGQFHADDHTFEMEIEDGQLRVRFDSRPGPAPLVNAIRVTQIVEDG
jgi:subtilisin family serine protease